ncbi:MAG: SIS domain-containing protein [Zestosphaera sp.]
MNSEYLMDYLDWPDLVRAALSTEPANAEPLRKPPEGVAVLGMGGSGIVGDVLQSMSAERFDAPLVVIKDFRLPRWVDRDWLVLAVSYSGDTMETLTCLQEALSRGVKAAVVASGGMMMELSVSNRLPHFRIPPGRTPRSSFPALLLGALKLLSKLGVELEGMDAHELLKSLEGSDALKAGGELADRLHGRMPVFISNVRYYPLALRAKDEFNENAKTVAKAEVYPEGFHNDVVGWEGWFGPVSAVIFREVGDYTLGFLEELLKSAGVSLTVYEISGDYVSNIIKWSQILGIASVETALRRGLNPRETKHIARYKEFLRKCGRTKPLGQG